MLRKLSIRKTLGLLALAPMALAVSTAHAQCSNDNLAVWSSTSALGGQLNVVSGGLGGTACRLNARLTANAGGATALVRDNSPSDEPRYRARFIVNVDSLAGINSIQSVRVFSAQTLAPANGIDQLVRMTVNGNAAGTVRRLNVFTPCEGSPGNLCSAVLNLVAGENTVEFDYQKGATGSLRVWLNNNVEASPNSTLTGSNAAWGGVDFATLGLATGSPTFRASFLNTDVQFDEFDSRRQSFIGQ